MTAGFLGLEGVRKEFRGRCGRQLQPGGGVGRVRLIPWSFRLRKTTTLRMVAGFEEPTSGSIRLAGKDVTSAKPNERNIGMVFQSYALFPNMTVARNVGFGLKVRGRPKAEIEGRVKEMLDLIQMGHLEKRYPYQLSGGQQQRVPWPAPWPFIRRCCYLTNRSRPWMPRSASRCAPRSAPSSGSSASPPSTSRTIRRRPFPSPIASS